jgi:hypothetical protein
MSSEFYVTSEGLLYARKFVGLGEKEFYGACA